MFFIYEKNEPNQILLSCLHTPDDFSIGCANVISPENTTLININWDNVDFEITDSECPEGLLITPMKYSYIAGDINESFIINDNINFVNMPADTP